MKDDSGAYAVFTEQGSSASQMSAAKSHGYHFQTARMLRTSSGCSICLHPDKNGGCTQIIEKFPTRNVQTFGYVFHDINGRNHGPVWKIPVVPLERNLYGGCEKIWNCGCMFVHRKQGLFLADISRRLVRSVPTNCLENLVFARIFDLTSCGP